MMTRERHIVRGRQGRRALAALVAGAAALCCLACINEYPDADALAGQGPSLALRVSLPVITDYADDDAASPVERMHNLRVIITHDIGGGKEMIEYNRYIDFDNTEGHFRYGYLQDPRLMFLINRKWITLHKNIYLFANSEPIFDRMLKDNDLKRHPDPEGGFYGGNHRPEIKQDEMDKYLEAIKEVTFTNADLQEFVKPAGGGTANGIPMSAEYRDVSLNPGNTGVANVHVMDAYIVRAANKITFTYTNERPFRDILVKSWGLEMVNKVSYLLPHVPANDETNKSLFGAGTEYKGDWIAWYSDHIRSGRHDAGELNFEVPASSDLGMGPYFGTEKTWSSVVGELSGDNLYKHYYDVIESKEGKPTSMQEQYGHYLPRWQDRDKEASKYETQNEPVYFLESIGSNNQEEINSDNGPVYHIVFSAQWQQYELNGNVSDSPLESRTFPAAFLDKVKTLFRNTHVHVDVAFRDNTPLDLYATIVKWEPIETVFSGNLNEEE